MSVLIHLLIIIAMADSLFSMIRIKRYRNITNEFPFHKVTYTSPWTGESIDIDIKEVYRYFDKRIPLLITSVNGVDYWNDNTLSDFRL